MRITHFLFNKTQTDELGLAATDLNSINMQFTQTDTSKLKIDKFLKRVKLNKAFLNIILILGILITFSSCNGQDNSQYSKASEKTMALGQLVSELDQTIWVIYQDHKSNFWFGSKENGVFYYNGQKLKHFSKGDGLISDEIQGIQEDASGNIYFETMSGISKFDGQSFKLLKIKDSDSPKSEWKLEPNDMWLRIGYDKKGPYRYDGKYLYYLEFPKSPQEDEFYSKYPNASHSPYGIYSTFKDSKGNMWFGTSDMGIYHFDGKKISWMYERRLTETANGGAFGIRSIEKIKTDIFGFVIQIISTRFYQIVLKVVNSIQLTMNGKLE